MAIVQSAAIAEVGIAKQTAEGSAAANPTYAHPTFDRIPMPTQGIERFPVTDINNTWPGVYKTTAGWEADITVPAFPASIGAYLKGVLPTDGISGASDPWTHAMTPTGSDAWFSLFSRRPGDLYEKFEDGLIEEVTIQFYADGPVRLGVRAKGKTVTLLGSPYTAGTTEKYVTNPSANAGEYFVSDGGVFKLDVNATPATTTVTNIVSGTIRITKQTDPVATADSFTNGLMSRGRYDVGVALDTVWQDYNAYKATFTGSTSGTTLSRTIVMGAIDFKFVSFGNTTNHDLTIAVPHIALLVPEAPQPDPSGSPFKVAIDGMAVQPSAGSIVTATLRNNVSAAY